MMARLLIFLFFFSSHCFASRQLLRVDVQDNAQTAKVFLTLDKPVSYRYFALSNPYRVVVDLHDTALRSRIDSSLKSGGLLQHVRYGFPAPGILRLVVDMKEPVNVAVSVAPQASRSRLQYLVMLSKKAKVNLKPEVQRQSTKQQPIKTVKTSRPVRMRDVVIVIDPGHGGKDPGAIGPHRTQEKHVTLAIARALKSAINRQPGMRAVLTRERDYYIGLRERLKIARKHEADLFVSIHADAFINQESAGVSVFALSERGATSEAARWLAEKENYSELGGVNLKALHDTSGIVRTVLIDLSQTVTISASLNIGGRVLGHLSHMTKLHKRHVEQARFMVLKSPDIPSILVETGYISNPREEKNLTHMPYQQKLALAIAQGIKTFFFDNPPQGSWLEAHTAKNHLYRTNKQAVSNVARHARLALNHRRNIAVL